MGRSSRQDNGRNTTRKDRAKLTVRPKLDELELLRHRARSFGYKSLSKYLIERGLREGVMIQSTDRENLERLLFEVRKIGVHLSSIAATMNMTKGSSSQDTLDQAIEKVERVLGEVAGEIRR